MKTFLTGLLIGAILASAALWRFHGGHGEDETHEEEARPTDFVDHNNDEGLPTVKLSKKVQEQIGLQTAKPMEAKATDETPVYGRVLNAADLPLLLAEINVAEVSLRGSTRIRDRIKKLNTEAGTVSEQKVEEAEEAMKKDEVALQAATTKLHSAWGPAIAGRKDLNALAKKLASNESALVRIDLPDSSTPKALRVALPGNETQTLDAEVIGPAPVADAVTQSASVLCLLQAKSWVPGTAIIGWIKSDEQQQGTASIPRSAIVRHEGGAFVFVKHEDEEFQREVVKLIHSIGDAWIVSGIKADDEIVVVGGQQLLSEEMKAASAEE